MKGWHGSRPLFAPPCRPRLLHPALLRLSCEISCPSTPEAVCEVCSFPGAVPVRPAATNCGSSRSSRGPCSRAIRSPIPWPCPVGFLAPADRPRPSRRCPAGSAPRKFKRHTASALFHWPVPRAPSRATVRARPSPLSMPTTIRTSPADLADVRQAVRLADPKLTEVEQTLDGMAPVADATWDEEISLDVEWAHAMAPGAKILLVEANTASLGICSRRCSTRPRNRA